MKDLAFNFLKWTMMFVCLVALLVGLAVILAEDDGTVSTHGWPMPERIK